MTLDITDLVKGKRILVLGAHPDDIELGMGGTLWKIRQEKIELTVFSSADNVNGSKIEDEFWRSMYHYGITLRTCLYQDIQTMEFYKFEDFIKNRLFYTREHFKPDIIFCPSPNSDNSDHAVVGKCVLNVFQEQSILYYEDIRGGRNHKPQAYVKLTSDEFMQKQKVLEFYQTQNKRKYFGSEPISSMAQFRGTQIGTNYAESFEIGRLVA